MNSEFLTKDVLEGYKEKFGVEQFNLEQIKEIAKELRRKTCTVSLIAAKCGFYKSESKLKKDKVEQRLKKLEDENKELKHELGELYGIIGKLEREIFGKWERKYYD